MTTQGKMACDDLACREMMKTLLFDDASEEDGT